MCKSISELLSLPANKTCADCGTYGPMWVSVNLGVFLCIKCAGLHRKLGVNVSRVKSVNLDRFSPEHLSQIASLGNDKVNLVYEARLPKDFVRPVNNIESLECFIENKYIKKEWYSSLSEDCKHETEHHLLHNESDDLIRMSDDDNHSASNMVVKHSEDSIIDLDDDLW